MNELPLPTSGAPLIPEPLVPALNQMQDLNEDDILKLTRLIRLRQINYVLEKNQGLMPDDPEYQKLILSQLKDLDNQALKVKAIGAKATSDAADREAAMAVLRALERLTPAQLTHTPQPGEPRRLPPSISDASNLKPLDLKPGETSVQIEHIDYNNLVDPGAT